MMKVGSKPETYFIETGQKWEIDLFRPEDAQGVVDLFISVYGTGYPIETYTDPKRLMDENAAANTISIVARTPKRDIVGHVALYRSAPYKAIYELGAGLVHKDYRGGKGILTDMSSFGMVDAAIKFGIEGIFAEYVCNHVFTQKACFKLGFITHAVEIDLMPASAYTTEKSATGRVSSLFGFKTLRPKPHAVYLPPGYEEMLRDLYAGLDDNRKVRVSKESFPEDSRSRIETLVFDFAQVARFAVHEIGADFEQTFSSAEKEAKDRGTTVFQAWLDLSKPWVGRAVDLLNQKGYFVGGLLPRWFDSDALLMTKLGHRPRWADMQIHFDRDKEIVHLIRTDCEKGGPSLLG